MTHVQSRGRVRRRGTAALAIAMTSVFALVAMSAIPAAADTSLDPTVAPGGNFDLSTWELQLPTGTDGATDTIPPSELEGPDGYQSQYFYTDSDDGSMVFWDPENGATLGSKYPRTELREMDSSGNPAEWAIPGTHVLSATLSASQIPSDVCVGQIHDDNSQPGSKPLLELYYHANGDITMGIEQTPAGGDEVEYYETNVPLGNQWSYVISLTGGDTINLSINDGTTTTTDQWPIPSGFDGYLEYFKAGDYDQSSGSDPSVGAQLNFYALSVSHSS
jgi:hypothetical protein